jgi:outer membrane protein assembly factor BamB
MINLMRLSIATLIFASLNVAQAGDWPQWRGPDRDGVWHETGIVESFGPDDLERVWTADVSNGYSGPTVANGRVYVTDRVVEPEEVERVLCFDAATGESLWTHEYPCVYRSVGYPDGPRASVTVADGRAFSLGTMGHLRCLDAETGELLWKKDPDTDYDIANPTWGITSAPLVEDDLVIVQIGAEPDACIVGLDVETGEERWRALEDKPSYSAPIVVEREGKRVLICWTSEHLVGLDPETGSVYWDHELLPARMVINVPTPVVDGNRLFLSAFYDGSYLFKLADDACSAELVWERRGRSERDTDALHAMISNPIIQGEYIYGVDSYGQFRCLELATGDRIWEDLTAVPQERWATIHTVRNGDRYLMFNDAGELLIATLSPDGLDITSRAKIIEPTPGQLDRGGGVSWSHPAYANRHVYVRSDTELVCVNLAAE